MSRTRRVVRGSPIFIFQIFIRSLIGFVLPVYLSESGGQELVGAYSFLLQLIGFCALLDLGIGQALLREFSQARGLGDSGRISEVVRSSFFLLALAGLITCIVILNLTYFIEAILMGSENAISSLKGALLIYAIWFLLRFPLSIGQILTFSSQKLVLFGCIGVTIDLIQLILIPVLIQAGYGLQALVVVIALSELFAFIFHFFLNREQLSSFKILSRPSIHELRSLLRVALPFGTMSVGDCLTFHSHSLVIGAVLGSAQLGAFHAMRSLGFLFASITWKLADMTFPGLNDLFVSESKGKLLNAFVRLAGYLCGLAIWLAVMVSLFNETFVILWMGKEYVLDGYVSILVGIYIPVSVLKNVSTKFVLIGQNLAWYMYIVLIEGAVVVILSVFLGSMWGASGVLTGMLLPQLVSFSFLLVRLSSMIGASVSTLLIALLLSAFKFSLPACVVSCLLITLVDYNNIRSLLVGASLISLVSFGLMIAFGLTKEDRTHVLSAMLLSRKI